MMKDQKVQLEKEFKDIEQKFLPKLNDERSGEERRLNKDIDEMI